MLAKRLISNDRRRPDQRSIKTPLRTLIAVAAGLIAAAVISGCGEEPVSEPTTQAEAPAQESDDASTEQDDQETREETGEDTADRSAPTSVRGTLAEPLPSGDTERSLFTFEELFSDTEWDGYIAGIIETSPGIFGDANTRCLLVLGVVTPSETAGAVSSGLDAPSIGLIADGNLIDDGISSCDDEPAAAAGYGWILNAEVTAGTSYPFFAEFALPDPQPAQIEAIVAGSPTGSDAFFFEATILESAPAPAITSISPAEIDIAPAGDPSLSAFTHNEIFSDTTWEGYVLGMVETGPGVFAEDDGRCVMVLGVITPTETAGAVTSGFDTPSIGVISDGRMINSVVGSCDDEAVRAAGYGWVLDADVTIGTGYPFFAEVLIPGSIPGDLQAIVIGSASGSDASFFEPTVSSEIPQPGL